MHVSPKVARVILIIFIWVASGLAINYILARNNQPKKVAEQSAKTTGAHTQSKPLAVYNVNGSRVWEDFSRGPVVKYGISDDPKGSNMLTGLAHNGDTITIKEGQTIGMSLEYGRAIPYSVSTPIAHKDEKVEDCQATIFNPLGPGLFSVNFIYGPDKRSTVSVKLEVRQLKPDKPNAKLVDLSQAMVGYGIGRGDDVVKYSYSWKGETITARKSDLIIILLHVGKNEATQSSQINLRSQPANLGIETLGGGSYKITPLKPGKCSLRMFLTGGAKKRLISIPVNISPVSR